MVRVKKEWFLTNSRTIFIEVKGSLNNFLLTTSKFRLLFNYRLLSTFIVIAHPFIRHLLNTYYVPGTGLNANEQQWGRHWTQESTVQWERDMATAVKREVDDECKLNRLDSRRQPSTLSARSRPWLQNRLATPLLSTSFLLPIPLPCFQLRSLRCRSAGNTCVTQSSCTSHGHFLRI